MELNTKEIQLQFEGFLKTPLLWQNSEVSNLNQVQFKLNKTPIFNSLENLEIRLGKRVEQFSLFYFLKDDAIKLIAKNIQIQNKKQTIGELDCLLLKDEKPIHIEIVYKFYLYYKSSENSEIHHWIGPNKKDSLIQKITKLKDKQLPLLYNKFTTHYLNSFELKSEEITQNVYFKAQLFVPLKEFGNHFELINNDCIIGFYITLIELNQFQNCKFYIPTKLNWLQETRISVNWISFLDYKIKIQQILSKEIAPLCWVKHPNGAIQKFFIVWWD
jgi:hypothetical protein